MAQPVSPVYPGAQSMVLALEQKCKEQEPNFWVPGIGNQATAGFLGFAIQHGLITVNGYEFRDGEIVPVLEEEARSCQCGSGQPWTTCGAASSYCG